jgi:iron(III) transport system permease protein
MPTSNSSKQGEALLWGGRGQGGKVLSITLVTLIIALLGLVPLLMLLYGSFRDAPPGVPGAFTLAKFKTAYSNPRIYESAWNTLLFSLSVTALSCTIGTFLAWITERTNVPFRKLIFLLAVVRIIIPGLLTTIGWIFLLSPRIGVINKLLVGAFNLAEPPFDLYTFAGMVWIESVDLVPLAFLLMAGGFRSMDPSLEEASLTSGAGRIGTFFRITLRLALPSLLATFLIIFVRGLESFEVPALIGMPVGIMVFSTEVYKASRIPPTDFGLAAAYSAVYLIVSFVGVYLYHKAASNTERFSTITGKGYKPAMIDLRYWRYPVSFFTLLMLVVLFVGPLLMLVWSSFLPFYGPPSKQMFNLLTLENYRYIFDNAVARRAFVNSLIPGFFERNGRDGHHGAGSLDCYQDASSRKKLLDTVAFLPIAIPGVVMAIALIWAYLTVPIGVYGTLWILMIAYVTKYMPYGMRVSYSSMAKIHKELEEAAAVSGSTWWMNIRYIVFPLVVPGFVSGWLWVMIHAFRELPTSLLLYGYKSEVVAVVVFSLWEDGNYPALSALAVLFMSCLAFIILGARVLGNRLSVEER